MKATLPQRALNLALITVAAVAVFSLSTGCSTSKAPTFYKTTLADPHPYPVGAIRTVEKPKKQANGTYLFTDPNGQKLEIPAQYVKSIEREKPQRDKNDKDLFESSKPADYKPSKEYFRGPFQFR